ncbi:TPA: hypothetical protein DDW35_08195 [Candidatus Sumerlaeota bacterium]|jgi:hypothetical protein|nr:hypothetical protein [Candidatus Sumerlaeota bacterium]
MKSVIGLISMGIFLLMICAAPIVLCTGCTTVKYSDGTRSAFAVSVLQTRTLVLDDKTDTRTLGVNYSSSGDSASLEKIGNALEKIATAATAAK